MLRIKILDKKNHPFSNRLKLYGMSIEAILIGSFALVVLLMSAYYIQSRKKGQQKNLHSITSDRALHTQENVSPKNN